MKIPIGIGIAAMTGCFACSSGGVDEPSVDHYLAEMDGTVDVTEQTLAAHHEDVANETELERIWDIEGRHLENMLGHMQAFDEAWLSMDACGAAMHRADEHLTFDTAPMAGAADELRGDIEMHWHSMLAAPDTATAWREEARYRDATIGLFDRMHGYEGDLMDSVPEDGFICPMHSHAHGMGMMHH